MAYSVQNPPIRHTNRVGGGTYWWYESDDSITTMAAAGYITNARYLKMEAGDILIRVDSNGVPAMLAVEEVLTNGSATLKPQDGTTIALEQGGTVQDAVKWVTPQMFDALANGSFNDTAAIQSAYTAAAANGMSVYFPNGTYVNNSTPSEVDDVHAFGSARARFIGTAIPLFSGVFSGGKEVALVSGVLRYYTSGDSGAGWYMLVDQGQDHDPILAGPITSGAGSTTIVLDINIEDFGLDPTLWTPSGFVCGPDETLAVQGVTFGASVGATQVTIQGSVPPTFAPFILESDGSNFSGQPVGYSLEWINNGTSGARLVVTRDSTNANIRRVNINENGATFPIVTPRAGTGDATAPAIPIVVRAATSGSDSVFEIAFFDYTTGARLTTQSTSMRCFVADPIVKTKTFQFQQLHSSIQASSNIWFVGTFVRKPASL